MLRKIPRPEAGEYAPHAIRYISLVPHDDLVLRHLREGIKTTRALLQSLTEDQLLQPYSAGKWSIKEILLHLADDERIYAYRALRFARGDTTPLPGFDQDAYTSHSEANARTLASLLQEFETVRRSTIALFRGLDRGALRRTGVADGARMSVRAIAYHIAGHELHHLQVIRERYLGTPAAPGPQPRTQ